MQRGMMTARVALCLVVMLCGACAWTGGPQVSLPESEGRAFRYVELPNALRVVLVSDPSADKAAAALDVNAGSRYDPQDRQGLAHFLEHMLFLGTEKYPDAGEYQTFIAAHGGSHNAYTAFEHTNYFFDVGAQHLEPALDRFAQFFIHPLFNAEYVQREVNAVDSEYRARLNNDQRRMVDVLKEQANQEHPFAKFSVGNLATLLGSRSEESLRQALLTFYDQNYVASRMTLVVLGRESLDDLEQMVRSRFTQVRNRDVSEDSIDEPLFQQTPAWINVRPQQELRELTVSFPIPDVTGLYRSKPFNYIGNLLGHEGEGSLLSLLKHRGWAEALSAGRGYEYRGGGIFSVQVRLTEAGLEHADEITDLLFECIDLLLRQGVEAWRYREQTTIGRQQFRFRIRPGEIHEVSQLAHNLHEYAVEDVLRGPYLMEDFDAAQIERMLSHLTVDNSLITLTVPGLKGERHSELYDVPYTLRSLSPELLARWRATAETAEVRLPAANQFIAQHFDIKPAVQTADKPELLSNAAGVELWYRQDREFALPKGSVWLQLRADTVGDSVERRVLSGLWQRMVEEQLNEYVYPAQLAGLNFSIRADWQSMELAIRGFDDRQSVLLDELAATVGSPQYDEARFERVKAQYIRNLENQRENEPYRQLMAELPRVLQRQQWSLDALIEAARAADLMALRAHVRAVMGQTSLRMLVHGNYLPDEARKLADIAARYLRGERRPELQPEAIVQLPSGNRVRELPVQLADSSLLLYLQAPEVSKLERVAMGVAGQMLYSDFFDELRTEKQLGYVVSAGVYPVREVPGLMFLVQSPVADASQLQAEFEGFLQRWLQRDDLEQPFERHKHALIARLEEAPRNLWEAGQRYWTDLLDNYPAFDSREQLLAALRPLTYAQWQQRLKEALGEQRQSLWLYSAGKWPQARPAGEPVPDLAEFKADQVFYQFP